MLGGNNNPIWAPCTSIQQSRSWQSKTNSLFRGQFWSPTTGGVDLLRPPLIGCLVYDRHKLMVTFSSMNWCFHNHNHLLMAAGDAAAFLSLFFFLANFVENKFTSQAMTTRNVWGLVLAFERVQILYLLLLVQTFCVHLPQMKKHTCKVFVLWPTVADCAQWHKKKGSWTTNWFDESLSAVVLLRLISWHLLLQTSRL